MRGIADKNHPFMDEPVDAAAVEGIDADPVELEGSSPDDFLDARDDVFRLLFLFRIGVGPELKIDAVDICLLYTSDAADD